jgi:hypothetical protein
MAALDPDEQHSRSQEGGTAEYQTFAEDTKTQPLIPFLHYFQPGVRVQVYLCCWTLQRLWMQEVRSVIAIIKPDSFPFVCNITLPIMIPSACARRKKVNLLSSFSLFESTMMRSSAFQTHCTEYELNQRQYVNDETEHCVKI